MKKWLIALVMVAALLAGCGSSSGDEDNSSASLGGVSSSLSSGGELSSGTLETAGSTSAPAPVAPDLSAPVDSTQDGISPDTPVSSDGQEMPQQPETPVQSTSSSQGAGTAPAQPQGAKPQQLQEQPADSKPDPQPDEQPITQPETSQPAQTTPPAEESPAPAPSTEPESQEPAKQSRTVYITPTGKRYHYDNSCNGGTYIESTLDEALSLGLTPCKKCAGG